MAQFPALQYFLNQISEKNVSSEVITQAEMLEEEISLHLAQTSDEKALLALEKSIRGLERLFRLELTKSEAEHISNQSFQFDGFSKDPQINSALAQLKHHNLESLIAQCKQFYATSSRRDEAMVSNLMREMKLWKRSSAALVVGGFHRRALTEQFKQKGISYAVLRPHLSHERGLNRYRAVMKSYFNPSSKWNPYRSSEQVKIPLSSSGVQLLSQISIIDESNVHLVQSFLEETLKECLARVPFEAREKVVSEWSERYPNGVLILRQEAEGNVLYCVERKAFIEQAHRFMQSLSFEALSQWVQQLRVAVKRQSIEVQHVPTTEFDLLGGVDYET
jgi:hypothetical protein